MRSLAAVAALSLAFCAFAPPSDPGGGRRAGRGESLVPGGTFETAAGDWRPVDRATLVRTGREAKQGSRSLRIVSLGPRSAGAFSVVPPEILRDRGLVHRATGSIRGRFVVGAWAKGEGSAIGKRFRVQLNEFGGVRPQGVVAAKRIRLTRRWKRVWASGRIARRDRSGVVAFAVLERSRRGDVYYVDDYRVAGRPPPRIVRTVPPERWGWWQYGLVWAAVLAAGGLWVAYTRRAAKTAARPAP